ncbi:MAG: GyrI-like domain-containing protein [Planctomycetes bacterium]|nr:GyrI-like domain-containing protein [Planctomycetota bacterium]
MLSSVVFLGSIALAASCFVGPFASARGDEPAPSAESILDRMDEACGDVSRRANLKSLRMTGGLQAPGAGAKITFTEVHVGTDRVLHTTAMGEFGSFTMGSTPTLSWSTDPALGITIREGDEQLGVVRWFAFNRRAPWRTLYAEAELVGVEDVDGDDCWKLRMNPKAGTDATWYVDQATHLPRKIDVKVPNPTGGDVAMSWLFEDWKDVDGIPFPYVKKMAVMGVEMVYRYTSIELDVDVAPAEIDPPADVQAAIDDPKLRSRIAPEKGGDVTIESVEPLVVVSVRATVKADEISRQLARMLPEVGGAVAQSGAEMTGPPFTRYHGGLDTPELDIEAGIPVKRRVETKGRAVLSELPGGKVATTWHIGPYGELPKTYALLQAWMKEHAVESAGGPWEIYWTDPGLEPDPLKWRTQILWPIKDAPAKRDS